MVWLIFVYLLLPQDFALTLRLLELRVPAHVAEGSDILLGCVFDLEEDALYAVKWYKDNQEFYRYMKYERPSYYAVPGVLIDTVRSSKETVWLKNVTNASNGKYMCEVIGEAPSFPIVSESKQISVHLLPENAPIVIGERSKNKEGDILDLTCKSSPSRPEIQLKWWINDELAPSRYLRGPWVKSAPFGENATTTSLRLSFVITSKYDAVIKLRCEGILAPMYNRETIITVNTGLSSNKYPPTNLGQTLETDSIIPAKVYNGGLSALSINCYTLYINLATLITILHILLL